MAALKWIAGSAAAHAVQRFLIDREAHVFVVTLSPVSPPEP
jgi:hypothetical protein